MSDVFDLPVRRISRWIFNCYLIDGGDGRPVVVDPGLPIVATAALAELEPEGRRPAAVVCTHAHPDHVAGVRTLEEHSGGPMTHLPSRCRDYLAGERPRTFPAVTSLMRFLPVLGQQPFDRHAAWEVASAGRSVGFGGPAELVLDFDPAGFVADGDPVPGAPGWEVIHTPGHTDDSTSLYHAESATLISGDAVVTVDGRAWFNPEFVDLDSMMATEERLRSLPVRHLLPGHGVPITAPDVWAAARRPLDPPPGRSILARCSRRLGRWTQP